VTGLAQGVSWDAYTEAYDKELTRATVVRVFLSVNSSEIIRARVSVEVRIRSRIALASGLYTVSQKTSPTFLAVTRESIVGFSKYLAHVLPRK